MAIRDFIERLAIRPESPLFGASRFARFAIRPTLLPPPPGGAPIGSCALAALATAAWAEDTLAGLADAGTTLSDGTALLVGHISFAAERGPSGARRAGR